MWPAGWGWVEGGGRGKSATLIVSLVRLFARYFFFVRVNALFYVAGGRAEWLHWPVDGYRQKVGPDAGSTWISTSKIKRGNQTTTATNKRIFYVKVRAETRRKQNGRRTGQRERKKRGGAWSEFSISVGPATTSTTATATTTTTPTTATTTLATATATAAAATTAATAATAATARATKSPKRSWFGCCSCRPLTDVAVNQVIRLTSPILPRNWSAVHRPHHRRWDFLLFLLVFLNSVTGTETPSPLHTHTHTRTNSHFFTY